MNEIEIMLERISEIIWGNYLIVTLIGVGIFFTIITKGIQIKGFPLAMKELINSLKGKNEIKGEGTLSALCTALSSCVGNGNIVGVATAIASGGPGAVFWMWAAGIVGMATKYAEIVLGIIYREKSDDGTYVGDALLEFLPENEERMIAYGDDLSVTGMISASEAAKTDAITVSKGVLNISVKHVYEKVYTFKNTSSKEKNIIVEHPIMNNSKLIEPQKYIEKTGALYRFDMKIKSESEAKVVVKEEVIKLNSTSIASFPKDTLIYYSTNKEISPNVQEFFIKAAAMYGEMDETPIKHKEISVSRE